MYIPANVYGIVIDRISAEIKHVLARLYLTRPPDDALVHKDVEYPPLVVRWNYGWWVYQAEAFQLLKLFFQ